MDLIRSKNNKIENIPGFAHQIDSYFNHNIFTILFSSRRRLLLEKQPGASKIIGRPLSPEWNASGRESLTLLGKLGIPMIWNVPYQPQGWVSSNEAFERR